MIIQDEHVNPVNDYRTTSTHQHSKRFISQRNLTFSSIRL